MKKQTKHCFFPPKQIVSTEKYIKVESCCFDVTIDSLRNEKTPKGFVAVLLINHEDEIIEAEMSLKNLQAFMKLVTQQNNEK